MVRTDASAAQLLMDATRGATRSVVDWAMGRHREEPAAADAPAARFKSLLEDMARPAGGRAEAGDSGRARAHDGEPDGGDAPPRPALTSGLDRSLPMPDVEEAPDAPAPLRAALSAPAAEAADVAEPDVADAPRTTPGPTANAPAVAGKSLPAVPEPETPPIPPPVRGDATDADVARAWPATDPAPSATRPATMAAMAEPREGRVPRATLPPEDDAAAASRAPSAPEGSSSAIPRDVLPARADRTVPASSAAPASVASAVAAESVVERTVVDIGELPHAPAPGPAPVAAIRGSEPPPVRGREAAERPAPVAPAPLARPARGAEAEAPPSGSQQGERPPASVAGPLPERSGGEPSPQPAPIVQAPSVTPAPRSAAPPSDARAAPSAPTSPPALPDAAPPDASPPPASPRETPRPSAHATHATAAPVPTGPRPSVASVASRPTSETAHAVAGGPVADERVTVAPRGAVVASLHTHLAPAAPAAPASVTAAAAASGAAPAVASTASNGSANPAPAIAAAAASGRLVNAAPAHAASVVVAAPVEGDPRPSVLPVGDAPARPETIREPQRRPAPSRAAAPDGPLAVTPNAPNAASGPQVAMRAAAADPTARVATAIAEAVGEVRELPQSPLGDRVRVLSVRLDVGAEAPVHARLSLAGNAMAIHLRVDDAGAASQLRADGARLVEMLAEAGYEARSLRIDGGGETFVSRGDGAASQQAGPQTGQQANLQADGRLGGSARERFNDQPSGGDPGAHRREQPDMQGRNARESDRGGSRTDGLYV